MTEVSLSANQMISKNGVSLRLIGRNDLELIRVWRNSDTVRLNMRYRELITPKMQEQWFQQLDSSRNIYMLILHGETAVGVCNVKEIDWDTLSGEGGVFIGNQGYLNTPIPVKAVLVFLEFLFEQLSFQSITLKILPQNTASLKFVVGFGAVESKTMIDHMEMRISKEAFLKSAIRSRYGSKS